ncbi:MAG: U32 family peptidase [Ruminococcaceae bacterium]|nr:U32 family peptidase [Oscillospiraceae bacterium]
MSIELLSPAGSINKLETAVQFGADAVYIGGTMFGLRTASENADFEQLKYGIEYAHNHNKKVYITTNIVARNDDLKRFPNFLKQLEQTKADAVIVTDFGLFSAVRELAPKLEIHVSTQANLLNYESCNAFYKMGAKRVVLARELSFEEIAEIRAKTDKNLELEAFVHGAMCVSFSGRCLLSDYMTARSANRGNCTQPCRFKYTLMEEKRPNEYMPVFEDENGTFILNSKDLCMIEHIDKLAECGITSFKIEGRVKSEFYVATITAAYRRAIDDYLSGKPFNPQLIEEVCSVSHREYCKGFYFGNSIQNQVYASSSYIRECDLIALVEKYEPENNTVLCYHRNRFKVGEELEILEPGGEVTKFILEKMTDKYGNILEEALHPEMELHVQTPKPILPHSIIRRRK